MIDGGAPWEEFSWIGREIALGGTKLAVLERTARCAATNVDPDTGEPIELLDDQGVFGPGGGGLHSLEEWGDPEQICQCRDILVDFAQNG